MLNRKPIFINGFSSGGTTILTNVLASHPDVCTVSEIHHLFKGHSLTDTALRAATDGNLEPFHELLSLVTQPFVEQPGSERYAEPASEAQNKNFQTYCGT